MRSYEICWGLGFLIAFVGAGCMDSDRIIFPVAVLIAGIGIIGLGFLGRKKERDALDK